MNKLTLIRTIDPYTFKPKVGIMDDHELILALDLEVCQNVEASNSNTTTLSQIKDMIKEKLDPSRHSEVDELVDISFKKHLTINEYQNKAVETAIYGVGNAVIYPTLGLAGEAGEVADKVKKVLRDNDGEFTEEKKREIAFELGDVLWYLAALARDLGYSLEEIAQANLDKLASRKARNVISGSGDNR